MRPVTKTYLYDEKGKFFGDGPYCLMREIEKTGSLRAAAQRMNMAYTKALSIVRHAEDVMGFPLTERSIGGSGGGGSRLTEEAKLFLDKYGRFREACKENNLKLFHQIFDEPGRLPLGCVLMASGMGTRFGCNKLMVDFRGKPMIQHILEQTTKEIFEERVVVTRYAEVARLCEEFGIQVILHDLPGRNDTIRLGLDTLCAARPDLEGVMFCACDQPLLSKSSLVKMATAFREEPDFIFRLGFEEKIGNPVIFPRSYFEQLIRLPEGTGGAALIRNSQDRVRCISALSAAELMDADTPEQLKELEQSAISE